MRGCDEPPESLAQGTLTEGFPRNLGELPVSCEKKSRYAKSRETEMARKGDGAVLRTHSTDDSGEPQGHGGCGGHGTQPREGGNKSTNRVKET